MSSKADIADVSRTLQMKADKEEVSEIVEQKYNELRKMLEGVLREVEEKPTIGSLKSMISKQNTDCLEAVSNAKKELSSTLKSSTKEILDLVKTKANLEEMNLALDQKANIEDVKEALDRKVDSSDLVELEEIIKKKASVNEVLEICESKVNSIDLEELKKELQKKASKESVIEALKRKLNVKDLKVLVDKYVKLEDLRKEMLLKANIKDLLTLLEEKSSKKDIEEISEELKRSLMQRVTTEQLSLALRDQAVINEAMLSQNTAARWIWKSGKLKSGHGVPWNIQVLNTNPENFIWEKDRVNIVVVQPGLYEIVFGFYSKKKPTVQLHVNGEPVLSAVNSSSYVVHHSSGRIASIAQHTAGNVTGLTLIDFIALPERARVAISYAGDDKCEGFMGLRKL